jgi:hypothetical protein
MPVYKPLVLGPNGVEELSSADSLDARVSEVDVLLRIAASVMIAGQVVYASSATQADKARANSDALAKPIGMATAAIASGASGSVQTNGVITLTTAEWDALCGTTGGLVVGTQYFLSAATAGVLTATAPSGAGNYVVPVIEAISPTEAYIIVDWTKRIKRN